MLLGARNEGTRLDDAVAHAQQLGPVAGGCQADLRTARLRRIQQRLQPRVQALHTRGAPPHRRQHLHSGHDHNPLSPATNDTCHFFSKRAPYWESKQCADWLLVYSQAGAFARSREAAARTCMSVFASMPRSDRRLPLTVATTSSSMPAVLLGTTHNASLSRAAYTSTKRTLVDSAI